MTKNQSFLERFAHAVTYWAGSSLAFGLALLTIIIWLVSGPVFDFNETWQLVINTGTTIITFLMIFLVQRAQNKDSMAVNAKLNELIAAMEGASNRLINVEDMSEEEVELLHKHYKKLVELAQRDLKLTQSHSIEEAEDRHEKKREK